MPKPGPAAHYQKTLPDRRRLAAKVPQRREAGRKLQGPPPHTPPPHTRLPLAPPLGRAQREQGSEPKLGDAGRWGKEDVRRGQEIVTYRRTDHISKQVQDNGGQLPHCQKRELRKRENRPYSTELEVEASV